MERWLLGLPSVGNQAGDKIDDKVGRAAVTSVFNLRDILELVVVAAAPAQAASFSTVASTL